MNADELAIAEVLDRLVAVEEFMHALTAAADEAIDAADDLPDTDLATLTTPAPAAPQAVARFTDVVTWVDRVLAPLWSGELPWCRQWWAHADVYERVTWLWRSWEAAMAGQASDDTAMAGWLRVADSHRDVLQARSGPFANCTPQRHGLSAPWLPVTARTLTSSDALPPTVLVDPDTPDAAERRRLASHYDED